LDELKIYSDGHIFRACRDKFQKTTNETGAQGRCSLTTAFTSHSK